MKDSGLIKATVAAAPSDSHTPFSVDRALHDLLHALQPPIESLVKSGDRVLVKVNMGCSGARGPEDRFTTHPAWLQAVILALNGLGAKVFFGDDVARAGKHCEHIWEKTGMLEVAKKTGATLIDFVSQGAREVRGGLLYPRSYLVTNAYFDADVIINAANCRSHANLGMSGAIKNMFGCVVGLRKQRIHNIFPGDVQRFARVIADVHRTIPADLSILDLTSVVEGHGAVSQVRSVGLVLASTDPVAVDTVAAEAIGYDRLQIWPTYYGNKLGLGCNDPEQISIRGVDWKDFPKQRLAYPLISEMRRPGILDRISTMVNNGVLRPRPVITASQCTGCGDCKARCPVQCIEPTPKGAYEINLSKCADCGCCLKVCEQGAVNLQFRGLAKVVRELVYHSPKRINAYSLTALDPAPGPARRQLPQK
ncbi:MAG: DUF362 domain-containing protein [Actinomycetota bacterium]